MEFLKTVLGSSQGSSGGGKNAPNQSGAETVERLVERLHSSTLLEDRRDACRALRSLSRKYRVEVGAQGMDAVLHILSIDRMDSEIVTYCVEILLNITSPTLLDDEDETMKDVGNQFTEIFIKKNENTTILLSLLDEYDFRIRLPLIKLLTNLLTNRPKEIQDVLLISPMGTSKLMDLLSDTREVIRNDAILLLSALTKNNSNIQKIIAFENGFDKILTIIHEEGYSDGGPVVEDCLNLFLSLLRNNTSNQTIFREGNYTKRILPFFQILYDQSPNVPKLPDGDELGWATQKVSNFYHMLQVVRTLVSPLNPPQVTLNCQRVMKTSGVLECLCNLLMASGIPVETLTEVIITVGELVRGSIENQEYFYALVAPSEPPRPALVILLMSLVNDAQLLSLRCAVHYCVNCYLFKNEKGQSDIVKSLLPNSSITKGVVTAGQLICSGLFSKDISTTWFSAVSLGHALLNNSTQKDLLLKVKLATRAETPAITLIHHILTTLNTNPKVQVKLALLQLLAIWLESCPGGITQFLSNQLSIQYLISQITTADMVDKEALVNGLCAFVMGLCFYFNPNTVESFNKENLHQLMTNRIGIEQITNGLSQITKSDYYLQSLKHPQISARHSTDLVFDHHFALLFKKYEPLILMQLSSDNTAVNSAPLPDSNSANDLSANGYKVTTRESPNAVIDQYKSFIRTQDEVIENYKKEIGGLQKLSADYKGKLEEMFGEVLQLKSQLTLVQAQRETNGANQRQIPEDEHLTIVEAKDKRIEELQLQVLKLESHYGSMATIRNPMQEELIAKLEEENKELVEEVERTKKDQEELLELLAEQDKRIYDYKVQLRQLGVQIPLDDDEELNDVAGSTNTDGPNGPVNNNIEYEPRGSALRVADEKVTYLDQLSQQQSQSYEENPFRLYQNQNHVQMPENAYHPKQHEPQHENIYQQLHGHGHEIHESAYQQQHVHGHENPYQQQRHGHGLENNAFHPFQLQQQPEQNHEQENGLLMASHAFSNSEYGGSDNFLL